MIDTSVHSDEKSAIEKGYLFPSKHRADLQRAFDRTRNLIPPIYTTLDEYLAGSSAKERHERILAHLNEIKADPSLASSLFIMELQFDRLHAGKMAAAIAAQQEDKGSENFKKGQEMQKKLLPWNRLKSSARYGVPSVDEIDPCAFDRMQDDFKALHSQLQTLMEATNPVLIEEFKSIETNMEELMKLFQLLGSSGKVIQK